MTLEVVHCYAGDAWLVEATANLRHQPLLTLSPEDAPAEFGRSAGRSGWKGYHTWMRQLAHWRITLEQPFDWVMLNDSDSFCLSPEIPTYLYEDPNVFWSNVLCHEVEHEDTDRPNFQAPYFMHRSLLEALEAAVSAFDPTNLDDIEFGTGAFGFEAELFLEHAAIDAMYTHFVMNVLGLPWRDYPDGATTWPPGRDLQQEIAQGARMVHGLKSPLKVGD